MIGDGAAEQGQGFCRVEELRTIQSRTDAGPGLSELRLPVPSPADQPPGSDIELVLRNRHLGLAIVGEKLLANYVVATESPNLFSAYGRRQRFFLPVPSGFRQDLSRAAAQGDAAIRVPRQAQVFGPEVMSGRELTGDQNLELLRLLSCFAQ